MTPLFSVSMSVSVSVIRAKKIVLSVGAWAPQLYGSHIPLPLHVERRVLFWFEPLSDAGALFEVRILC